MARNPPSYRMLSPSENVKAGFTRTARRYVRADTSCAGLQSSVSRIPSKTSGKVRLSANKRAINVVNDVT